MNQNLTIKSWAEDDKPREKMILKGRNALSDAELLAIIIGSGSRNKSAVELAQEMLSKTANSLSLFGKNTLNDLMKFKGVGEAKGVAILAALEFGRRRKESDTPKKIKIRGSRMIYEYLDPIYKDLKHEESYIILLNRSNEIIRHEQISKGGLAGTIVDGKIIFKLAIDHSASSIVLSHNHPSGALYPSEHDKKITKDLLSFGKLIDLPILDHLIFTDNGYFSFADEGILYND